MGGGTRRGRRGHTSAGCSRFVVVCCGGGRAFLELPPRPSAVRRGVILDPVAQEALRKSREAMAEHRRAAARKAAVQLSDEEEDADEAPAPAPAPAAPSGKKITIFMQLRNGQRLKCACREVERFGKILEDFLASTAGETARNHVGAAPRLVFDGETIDPATKPADLDMESEDVVDLQ